MVFPDCSKKNPKVHVNPSDFFDSHYSSPTPLIAVLCTLLTPFSTVVVSR